jgi:hypothetical protein
VGFRAEASWAERDLGSVGRILKLCWISVFSFQNPYFLLPSLFSESLLRTNIS